MRSVYLLIGLLLGQAAWAAAPEGAALYQKFCAACHDQSKETRAPDRETLKRLSPESVLATLTSGTMEAHSREMSAAERRAIAEFLTGKPFGSQAPSAAPAPPGSCTAGSGSSFDPSKGPRWNGWGVEVANTRFQPAAMAGLSPDQVRRLKLKWALGFPGATLAYAQPTVAGGRVLVGSAPATVYSLDAATGCIHWSYQASAGVRTAISIGALTEESQTRSRPRRARYAAYFGDVRANVYAVDASTGALLWKTRVEEHHNARITGAPALHAGRLYVPVSSVEEVSGGNPKYECCTFRGSVVALDAQSGKQIWKTYTIAEAAKPTTKNSAGTQLWGPSGAAIWSAPTLDLKRRAIYVATGNNYTEPETETSDAILALDMGSGGILWTKQMTPGDAWNFSCQTPGRGDCAPDFDFGSSPILRSLPGGRRDVLVVGQKSGMAFGLDPDRQGEILWSVRVGKGGALGGVEWGPAADEKVVYVAVADRPSPEPETAGQLFALGLATGDKVWHTPAPRPACADSGAKEPGPASPALGRCTSALSAAVTAIPGVVFSGSIDGHLRAFSSLDGSILWDFNTVQDFSTVNEVKAKGGSLDGPGPTVVGGMLFVNSGYGLFRGLPGNVLLAFSPDGK